MSDLLATSLGAAGKASHRLDLADAEVLLLPYGARVLGLYAPGSTQNFYWTHPLLERADQAAQVFAPNTWHNTGGDRTWLTPELDIFFPDYPDTSRHWAPIELDASDYLVEAGTGCVTLSRAMTLRFARAQRSVGLTLSKRISTAGNPLRHERESAGLMKGVQYAGYTQTTTLELTDHGASPVPIGLWNLIQAPHGGEVIIPTRYRTQPRVLFGDIPEEKLQIEERGVRFRADFPGEHKFAVRAAASTGRVGYLRAEGSGASLIVRNFSVNPSGEYVDVPKNDPADVGYAVHVVSVDSALGQFSELEYHAPALGCASGQVRSEDISQVWAFRGPETTIHEITDRLLGAV